MNGQHYPQQRLRKHTGRQGKKNITTHHKTRYSADKYVFQSPHVS